MQPQHHQSAIELGHIANAYRGVNGLVIMLPGGAEVGDPLEIACRNSISRLRSLNHHGNEIPDALIGCGARVVVHAAVLQPGLLLGSVVVRPVVLPS